METNNAMYTPKVYENTSYLYTTYGDSRKSSQELGQYGLREQGRMSVFGVYYITEVVRSGFYTWSRAYMV